MEEVGARQRLELVVPLPDGLSAQAAVQLHLLHTLVEPHHMAAQLPLPPLAAIDAFTQAVKLQQAKLVEEARAKRTPKASKKEASSSPTRHTGQTQKTPTC